MKIGITGTREGANDSQLKRLAEYMMELGTGHEFHHGDCRGVDVEVAAIARHLGWRIVCHPPKKKETQGFYGGDVVMEPQGYLQRDRNIVDAIELLLVVPLHDPWRKRGGTWYTYSYALKQNKTVKVFYPNRKE